MNLKANKISHREELVNILDTFKNHKSAQMIKLANFHSYSLLNFSKVTESEVKKEILNLSAKKATKNGEIPAKILKKSVGIYLKEITFIINDCIENGIFPDDLKLADVSPIFKKEDSFKKGNYRPVSILPHISKVFERILYKQIDTFMTTNFFPYLCGFRTNHNAQYSLLKMIEAWKKHLDKGEKIGVILMDLSKAFDTINHSLLLAKLDAYGFSRTSLKLMQNYLCNRQQRISINGSFSDWTEVITRVPQGSILGPLLFNIFLNGIFMFISKCDLCNYADDNTLYSIGKDLNRIRRNLEMEFMILHQWFHENHMTLNPGNCHYIVIGSRDLSHEIMLNNNKITSSNEEKLLDIFIDSKLNFESHIGSLCRKADQKISALARLTNYLTSDKRNSLLNSVINLLLNSVIKSQFTYCPLIWMFTSRYLHNALNNIHEWALRVIYNDHENSFNSILTENNLKAIHQKNLEFLAIEIYKFQNGLSPPIMNDIFFSRQNVYNLQKFQELSTSIKNAVNRGPHLWNLIPDNIKSEPTLELFKKKIRKCKCEPCPCRMCKTYLQHIGFIS